MQPSTATQTAASHNPRGGSSGKRAFPLAAKVARELGLVPTWPNLQTIRLALESEAKFCQVTVAEVAEMIVRAGNEWTTGPQYTCPAEWEKREISRINTVDRFWFEDARWRFKKAYFEFRERRRRASEQIA
jgi:hypothetical protein